MDPNSEINNIERKFFSLVENYKIMNVENILDSEEVLQRTTSGQPFSIKEVDETMCALMKRLQQELRTLEQLKNFSSDQANLSVENIENRCRELDKKIETTIQWIFQGHNTRQKFSEFNEKIENDLYDLNDQISKLEHGIPDFRLMAYGKLIDDVGDLVQIFNQSSHKSLNSSAVNLEVLRNFKGQLHNLKFSLENFMPQFNEAIGPEIREALAAFRHAARPSSLNIRKNFKLLEESFQQISSLKSSLQEGLNLLRQSKASLDKEWPASLKEETGIIGSLLNPVHRAKGEIQKEYQNLSHSIDKDIRKLEKWRQTVDKEFKGIEQQRIKSIEAILKIFLTGQESQNPQLLKKHLYEPMAKVYLGSEKNILQFKREIAPLFSLDEYLSEHHSCDENLNLLRDTIKTAIYDANNMIDQLQKGKSQQGADASLYTQEVLDSISLSHLASLRSPEKQKRMQRIQNAEAQSEREEWSETGKKWAGGLLLFSQAMLGVQFLYNTWSQWEASDLKGPKAEAAKAGKCRDMIQIALEETSLSLNEIEQLRIRQAAEALDDYVEKITPKHLEQATKEARAKVEGRELTREESEKVSDSIASRLSNTVQFFCLKPGENETPLIKIARSFSNLSRPSDPIQQRAFDLGAAHLSTEIMKATFDQHFENPEQYVSHGFDHSLNVSEYATTVLELNPQLSKSLQNKYHITEGEARFLMGTLGMMHDVGYPLIGNKGKLAHGVAGADRVAAMLNDFDQVITSPEARLDAIKMDFYEAILFHSADKIETFYTTQIVTNWGNLLADHKNIARVVSIIRDPAKNPAGLARTPREVKVQSEEMRKEVQEQLVGLGLDKEVKVTVSNEGLFPGRPFDLETKKDLLSGLQFSEVDLLDKTLLGVLRLTDNFDMTESRFSLLQKVPQFKQVYKSLGAETGDMAPIARLAKILEGTELEVRKMTKEMKGVDRKVMEKSTAKLYQNTLRTGLQELKEAYYSGKYPTLKMLAIGEEQISRIRTYTEMDKVFKNALVDSLVKDIPLPEDTLHRLREIALEQDTMSYRHFGGCEPVKNVALRPAAAGSSAPDIVITIDRDIYEEHKHSLAVEVASDPQGNTHVARVPVSHYQIWRAEEAYSKLSFCGEHVTIIIQDEYGNPYKGTWNPEAGLETLL